MKNVKLFVVIVILSLFISIIDINVSAVNVENPTRKTLPTFIQDGDWLSDRSKIIFSNETNVGYWGIKYRLFIANASGTDGTEITNASEGYFEDIDYLHHVAPLVSPDEQKVVFIATRNDQPCTICVMNPNGTGAYSLSKMIRDYPSSLVFTWFSNEEIIFWRSVYSYSDFNPDILSHGYTYIVNINNGDEQELTEVPEEIFKGKFVTRGLAASTGAPPTVRDLMREGYTFQTENQNQEQPNLFLISILLVGGISLFIVLYVVVTKLRKVKLRFKTKVKKAKKKAKKEEIPEEIPFAVAFEDIVQLRTDELRADELKKIKTVKQSALPSSSTSQQQTGECQYCGGLEESCSCGSQSRYCQYCGEELLIGQQFCSICGLQAVEQTKFNK
ncbi:MAG: zinc ribbon domain-containing protein [Candidatus Nealsonbacteria bacterium]|nr:MAG: zinc ribbon domain-containing protein [Candidatus Nealsonbacteria bacterium]